jgi:hypothetical protein
MKKLVHDGTACRLSAIKSLFGDDHMEFDDFKDVESFMQCRAYDARAYSSEFPERQRFEVYLHAFKIFCQSEDDFIAAAKLEWTRRLMAKQSLATGVNGPRPRSGPSTRPAGQCTSVERSRAASGASGGL